MKTSLKKLIILFTSLIIITGCNNVKKENSIRKVGVVIPLTGQWSDYGVQMKRGIDLWISEHPHSNIKVLFEDGQAMPRESVNAFRLLINKGATTVITGFSGVVLALAPIAERNKIALINAGATNPNIKNSGKYIFDIIPDAEIEAKFIADFLIDSLKIKSCGIYWQNNDAGKGMYTYFSKEFTKLGGNIKCSLPQNTNQQDYKNDLLKFKKNNVNTIFAPTYSKDLGLIIRQASDLGMNNILWVGYAATETKNVLDIAGSRLNGHLIYSYYGFNSNAGPETKTGKFDNEFEKKYKTVPGLYSATFYDAISIVDAAIKNHKAVKDYIYSLRSFNGVSGVLEFDHKNYVSSNMRMKMVWNTKFANFEKSRLHLNQ